ncbi:GNAT family N-acetyltransferase [Plectonema cf. radiosum LEGE 06105]|uniref:GNAT family N-acetyltransferase n=1 Tax=Plectonema cf. radiosum LEGE 06105 TaxID=945769 RepID=A0A8J7FA62_9CYAN|nr:GNAT family N-acetyltransferase [Plectonema radiosum]MBE9214749.1 GNAT family N-acetyltransferase [Plectonema cf. radiosum LEGE 06105]
MKVSIRETTPQEDSVIAEHFYQLWLDIGVSKNFIKPNHYNLTLEFIKEARQKLFYKGFVVEVDNLIVGSASCQLFTGLYPNVLKEGYRKYGYIWGVYVEPFYRKKGIAKQLTHATVEYLKTIGCTKAILNASPAGKSVYESLGFSLTNAMELDLI